MAEGNPQAVIDVLELLLADKDREIERLKAEIVRVEGLRRQSMAMQEGEIQTLRAAGNALEAQLAKVVEALKVAREYVKATEGQLIMALKVARGYVKTTEGQLVIQPNVVTKDRELCDAALAAAQPKGEK